MRTLRLDVRNLLGELEQGVLSGPYCFQRKARIWAWGFAFERTFVYGMYSFIDLHQGFTLNRTGMGVSSQKLDWTDSGRCHLLWTMICSSTSGLCFPVSRLSCSRWPKLSLFFLFSRWWGLIGAGVSEQLIAQHRAGTLSHKQSILFPSFITGAANRAGAGSVPLCHTHPWMSKSKR